MKKNLIMLSFVACLAVNRAFAGDEFDIQNGLAGTGVFLIAKLANCVVGDSGDVKKLWKARTLLGMSKQHYDYKDHSSFEIIFRRAPLRGLRSKLDVLDEKILSSADAVSTEVGYSDSFREHCEAISAALNHFYYAAWGARCNPRDMEYSSNLNNLNLCRLALSVEVAGTVDIYLFGTSYKEHEGGRKQNYLDFIERLSKSTGNINMYLKKYGT